MQIVRWEKIFLTMIYVFWMKPKKVSLMRSSMEESRNQIITLWSSSEAFGETTIFDCEL